MLKSYKDNNTGRKSHTINMFYDLAYQITYKIYITSTRRNRL